MSLPEISVQRSRSIIASAAPGLERRQRHQAGARARAASAPTAWCRRRGRTAGVEIAVVGAHTDAPARGPGVAQHVVVRQHRALRIRRGAGGELDQQQVVGLVIASASSTRTIGLRGRNAETCSHCTVVEGDAAGQPRAGTSRIAAKSMLQVMFHVEQAPGVRLARQNSSSAALNRVFTGTVTAPMRAAP